MPPNGENVQRGHSWAVWLCVVGEGEETVLACVQECVRIVQKCVNVWSRVCVCAYLSHHVAMHHAGVILPNKEKVRFQLHARRVRCFIFRIDRNRICIYFILIQTTLIYARGQVIHLMIRKL